MLIAAEQWRKDFGVDEVVKYDTICRDLALSH